MYLERKEDVTSVNKTWDAISVVMVPSRSIRVALGTVMQQVG